MPEKEILEDSSFNSTVEVEPHCVSPTHPLPPVDSRPKRSWSVRLLIWLLVLASFAVVIWYVLHQKAPEKARTGRAAMFDATVPVTINTVTPSIGDLGVYLEAIGTVTPVYTDTITSQASGLLTEVNYHEGQLVQKGQLLAKIDPRPYQAQVETVEGTLAHDEGLLAEAKIDLTRYQGAWAQNAIAKQTLDDQETLVQQDEGQVKADEGNLALDKVNLSYCTITAPISGRVGLRLVDPGNVISSTSATPLVVITQLHPITVVFTIPEDSVGEVEAQMHGKPLNVTAYDRTAQTELASGTLLTTDNQIDTTTGTLKLRAIFDNEKNSLFPNQFVNTRLLVKMLHGVTRIPSSAIQYNGPLAYVFLIKHGIAHIQAVKPGATDGALTELTGINPGDIVADSSFEKLQDNSKVNLLAAANFGAAGSRTTGPSTRNSGPSQRTNAKQNQNSKVGNTNENSTP